MKTNTTSDALLDNKLQKKMVISPKKQRDIAISNLSLTGSISSIKNNDAIQFESSLERDYIYLLEFDKEVYRYIEQPFKLHYYQDNILKYYIPDFYIEYWNGLKELVEIKYHEDCIKNKMIYQKKFKVADSFCKANNIDFKVLTEKEIRTHQLFNATFLLSYKHPKYGFNMNNTQIILKTLEQYGQLTVNQLLDISVKSENGKAELLYVIWYLVSNYLVYFDNNMKLSMETKLWLPKM